MREDQSLAGKLLIAMPGLQDPNFERAVLFLCSHSDDGALGLVINQSHPANMEEVVAQLGLEWKRPERSIVFQGGPVALDRGFILYERLLDFPGHLRVSQNLYLGTNPEILRSLVEADNDSRFLFALGYSGWGAGQLEAELRNNAWLVSGLDRQILFDPPIADRWEVAIRRMGIDPVQLMVPDSGMSN